MIQRIQSVYLFLAFILNGTLFFNAIYIRAMQDPQEWVGMGFTVVLILVEIVALVCIFLYKNRANQLRWAGVVIVLQTIAFGYSVGILISLGGVGAFIFDEAVGVGLLLISLIATLMARKKIKEDDELVRSMDRIR